MRAIDTRGHALPAAENGSTLVATLAIVTAVLLVGTALFIMGNGEADLVEYTVDSARAFCLAEAGQSYARAWLRKCAEEAPPVYPNDGQVVDRPLGGGEYEVDVNEVTAGCPWLVEYEVVATGEISGVCRSVRTRLRSETFAQFGRLTGGATDVALATGDSLYGPVHSNGHINIDGDTWFGGKVTTSEGDLIVKEGASPTFLAGYELGVAQISYPDASSVTSALVAAAQSGGTYCGVLSGVDPEYEVVLGKDGALGYLSYRRYSASGQGGSTAPWNDVDISSTNGVFWFEHAIFISGTLDGEATIGCGGDVLIIDDILYEDSSPGFGPDPGCDDMLGIIADGDIIIDDTTPNQNDCEIHGHFMALSSGFTAESYNQGAPRGDIILWGGTAEANGGPVGRYDDFGTINGYSRDFHFDERLLGKSPPYYPLTGRYITVSWEETAPPES